MPDEKRISDLYTAPDVDEDTLLEVTTVDGGGNSSYKSTLSFIFDKILKATRFTQRLNTTDKTVFGAINELQAGGGGGGSSTLSGLTDVDITTPSNGQVLKYDSTSQKWENAAESGGSANIVECTQAEYDAWEQGGTLDPDTAYFINDGNIGSDIIDDSSTSQDKVWSAYKTNGDHTLVLNHDEYIGNLSDDLASPFSTSTAYAVGDYVLYGKILYRFTSAKTAGDWDSTKVTSVKVGTELASMNVKSVTRVATTVTTGSTGNIATDITNDGYHFIVGAFIAVNDYACIPWVTNSSNKWFIKVRGIDSWQTVNNTQVDVRYWIVETYKS